MKYLTTTKVYKQVFFYVINYNLNWEILTKNLVTCRRCDGVKEGKLVTEKSKCRGEGVHKKPIHREGGLSKWGGGHSRHSRHNLITRWFKTILVVMES